MASPLYSVSASRLVIAVTIVAMTIVQVIILRQFGWPLIIAFSDSIISNFLLAIAALSMTFSLRSYNPGARQINILIWGFALTAIWLFVSYESLMQLFQNQGDYPDFLYKSLLIRFVFGFILIRAFSLIVIVSYQWQDQRENELRKQETEKLARDAELFKLRQQLQPHFLFNSLNSINALIGSKPDEARRMIQELSEFLRGTIRKEENQQVILEEELHYLQLYLDIEKVRFGHRLNTEITCSEAARKMKLPALLLQPLMENAIKFGLYDTTEEVTIKLTAESVDSRLILSIQNPFDPETAQPQKGTGFGLSSVQRRLFLLFGRNDLLETKTADHTFITTVKIPQTL